MMEGNMDKHIRPRMKDMWRARARAAGPMKDRRHKMTDEEHIEEQLDGREDCPWKCEKDNPNCLCMRGKEGEESDSPETD
jgi:hypothetical protein